MFPPSSGNGNVNGGMMLSEQSGSGGHADSERDMDASMSDVDSCEITPRNHESGAASWEQDARGRGNSFHNLLGGAGIPPLAKTSSGNSNGSTASCSSASGSGSTPTGRRAGMNDNVTSSVASDRQHHQFSGTNNSSSFAGGQGQPSTNLFSTPTINASSSGQNNVNQHAQTATSIFGGGAPATSQHRPEQQFVFGSQPAFGVQKRQNGMDVEFMGKRMKF